MKTAGKTWQKPGKPAVSWPDEPSGPERDRGADGAQRVAVGGGGAEPREAGAHWGSRATATVDPGGPKGSYIDLLLSFTRFYKRNRAKRACERLFRVEISMMLGVITSKIAYNGVETSGEKPSSRD